MATRAQDPVDATVVATEPSAHADLPADFAGIYAAHSQSIHYLALRLTGDPIQAQDITHDVFLKAFRNFDGFRGRSALRTWLYRITVNHCSHIRQSWAARKIQTAEDDAIFDRVDVQAPNPLHVLETKELGERIQRTLDSLPEEYSLLLLLVADQELSYEQIAEVTGQSPDAVRGKLHRARKAFSRAFARTA